MKIVTLYDQADLILLLISQDFIASPECYSQALQALQLSREDTRKKLAVISLRPNGIEDTPFKDLPRLPPGDVCVSQYRDTEQGYWDAYQGIKTMLDPQYRYKNRPKIISWRTTALVSAVLLVWSLFILLLRVGRGVEHFCSAGKTPGTGHVQANARHRSGECYYTPVQLEKIGVIA